MSNLLKRILTGLSLGGIAITGIVLSAWGAYVLCVLVSVVGLYELYQISGIKSKLAKGFFLAGTIFIWAAMGYELANDNAIINGHHFYPFFKDHFIEVFAALSSIGAILLLFEKKVKHPAQEMGLMVMGIAYVVLPMILYFKISFMTKWSDYSFQTVLGILFLTWAVDTAAYFGGRFLGKHKLWERISPKKTWEGSISGAIACIGLSFGLNYFWPVDFNWVVVGVLVAVVSQFGDLVESMYKRGLQIKDSGGILPGHGGVLDRFDGLLISIPIIYLYLQSINWF